MRDRIPTAVISHAATELTANGLTGSKLVEITSAYAADFSVDIPHARYPFDCPNKHTALLDNLVVFSPKQQYQVIRELCDRLNADGSNTALTRLKVKLMTRHCRSMTTASSDVTRWMICAWRWSCCFAT
jgi:hypothetical protein